MSEKKQLLLIDANSLIHRAFHALPSLTTSKGEMVNAVYGFLLVLFKTIKKFQPEYIAAAFDVAAPTLRHRQFQEYKAKRAKAPDELYEQIPRVKRVLEVLGIPFYEKEGFEADDVIGTIATLAPKRQIHPLLETIILSGDLDYLQLVDEHTKTYTPRKGLQDSILYDESAVKQRFEGLTPQQMADYKGLRGDPSDNIPGVPGIGEKTAIQLLNEFGSLETLYGALQEKDEKAVKIKPKLVQSLLSSKDQAFLSKDLATIRRDVPLELRLSDLHWQNFNRTEAEQVLKSFEFESLLNRLPELKGQGVGQAPEASSRLVTRREEKNRVEEKLENLFREGILSRELYEIEKKLMPVIRAMEQRGIKIDKPYFAVLSKEISEDLKGFQASIYQLSGEEFNINASKQLSRILFDRLGLSMKGLKKTARGTISTASGELKKLRDSHVLIPKLLVYRKLQKLWSTYIKPLPQMADANGRIHTHFDQLGTATGRISSANPNLQNIPIQSEWGKRIRKCFIGEKGNSLVSFDYSQMELRIVAHVAEDSKMQETFWKGQDIHRVTASEVFGVPMENVTKEMRHRAKALNFGVLYGMGPRGFSETADVSLQEAEKFIEHYFVRFPKVYEYFEKTRDFARRHGYTETMFGRKRSIPQIHSKVPSLRAQAEREAANHPIQGSAADIMKMAMVNIYSDVLSLENRAELLLQIHDELVFEIPNDIIKQVIPLIQKTMEQACVLRIPLKVEASVGKNWNDLFPFY